METSAKFVPSNGWSIPGRISQHLETMGVHARSGGVKQQVDGVCTKAARAAFRRASYDIAAAMRALQEERGSADE